MERNGVSGTEEDQNHFISKMSSAPHLRDLTEDLVKKKNKPQPNKITVYR